GVQAAKDGGQVLPPVRHIGRLGATQDLFRSHAGSGVLPMLGNKALHLGHTVVQNGITLFPLEQVGHVGRQLGLHAQAGFRNGVRELGRVGGTQGDHGHGTVTTAVAGGTYANGGVRVQQVFVLLVDFPDGVAGGLVVHRIAVEQFARVLPAIVFDADRALGGTLQQVFHGSAITDRKSVV